jgi:NADH dehydrogenase FAD-containing subunit
MPAKIVVVGTGFAGVWSALSAQRLIRLRDKERDVQVVVVAPEPTLVIRVRLYEAQASKKVHPVGQLFESAGIQFVQGYVETVNTQQRTIRVRASTGSESEMSYDRLVLAAGSSLARPSSIPGIEKYAFDINSLSAASALETHFDKLASLPPTKARDTVVVCGAGFTGIEMATELPLLLSHLKDLRIVLVESSRVVGPELGPNPRPTINKALKDLGIEVKLGSPVTSVNEKGVLLASGELIESKTVIWTAGLRANSLNQQVPGEKDALGRLHVDQHLRVAGCQHVFAAGDSARAATDDKGNFTLMSCQHAIPLGRFAGHNAVAGLLGEPMMSYAQPEYTCLLDLGAWGALLSYGWERDVKVSGKFVKQAKRWVNQKVIYPPNKLDEALKMAEPTPQQDGPVRNVLSMLAWTWSSWMPSLPASYGSTDKNTVLIQAVGNVMNKT